MGRGSEALEKALLSEEERTGIDGEDECAPWQGSSLGARRTWTGG